QRHLTVLPEEGPVLADRLTPPLRPIPGVPDHLPENVDTVRDTAAVIRVAFQRVEVLHFAGVEPTVPILIKPEECVPRFDAANAGLRGADHHSGRTDPK